MKRVFLLVVAVMLACLPALGLAEGAGYTDPDGRFAFPCPEGWTVLSKENMADMLKTAETIEDETFQRMVESARPQIEQLGMVILMSADYTCNINVICRSGMKGVTSEALLSVSDTFKSELSSQLESLTFLDEPAVYTVGDWEPMMFSYEYVIVGVGMSGAQVYLPKDDNVLIFTLTAQSGQEEQGVNALMEMLLGLQ